MMGNVTLRLSKEQLKRLMPTSRINSTRFAMLKELGLPWDCIIEILEYDGPRPGRPASEIDNPLVRFIHKDIPDDKVAKRP